jgi:hypothetical protein
MSSYQLAKAIGSGLRTSVFCAAALCSLAHAASIDVSPSQSSVLLGAHYDVRFDISQLTSDTDDSLAGFDLNVKYDPAFVTLVGYSFVDPAYGNNQLDLPDPASLGFVGSVGGFVPIDVVALSGNQSIVLDDVQANSFRFLTLTFSADHVTSRTDVAIDLKDPDLQLVNPAGAALPVSFKSSVASVAITGAVPEPEVLVQVASGGLVLGLVGWVRRRKGAAALAGALMLASTAHAQSSVTDAPTPIDAVVIEVAGTRVKVLTDDARVMWVSTTSGVTADKVGMRIKGEARALGDTIVVSNEVYVANKK